MPVKVFKVDDQWCVHDVGDDGSRTGKSHGCHDSESDAKEQASAINANTEKQVSVVPLDVYTFEDLQRVEETFAAMEKADDLVYQFHALVDNIMYSFDIADKGAAMNALVAEFGQKIASISSDAPEAKSASAIKALSEKFKGLFASRPRDKAEAPEGKRGLLVWKGDSGQYHWLARYSNSFRDNDNPPEIISSESHKRFVKMVESGEYPLPELWLWHEPSWKWGEATFVAFDEVSDGVGFALAGGVVDKGKEWIAEAFMNGAPSLVSHGMPGHEIARDKSDSSIYLQHQTIEVSPLPPARAANKMTGFEVFKEKAMALSDEKRREMAESLGVTPDALREVERTNSDQATKAVANGVQFKQQDTDPAEGDSDDAEKEGAQTQADPGFVTEAEFAKFADELQKGMKEALGVLVNEVKSLKGEVATLKEQREIEEKSMTPAASIYSVLSGAVADFGKKDAKPTADQLKDAKPKETEPAAAEKPHTVSFINDMHSMNRRGVR